MSYWYIKRSDCKKKVMLLSFEPSTLGSTQAHWGHTLNHWPIHRQLCAWACHARYMTCYMYQSPDHQERVNYLLHVSCPFWSRFYLYSRNIFSLCYLLATCQHGEPWSRSCGGCNAPQLPSGMFTPTHPVLHHWITHLFPHRVVLHLMVVGKGTSMKGRVLG